MGIVIALATACFLFVYIFAARDPLAAGEEVPETALARVPVEEHNEQSAA